MARRKALRSGEVAAPDPRKGRKGSTRGAVTSRAKPLAERRTHAVQSVKTLGGRTLKGVTLEPLPGKARQFIARTAKGSVVMEGGRPAVISRRQQQAATVATREGQPVRSLERLAKGAATKRGHAIISGARGRKAKAYLMRQARSFRLRLASQGIKPPTLKDTLTDDRFASAIGRLERSKRGGKPHSQALIDLGMRNPNATWMAGTSPKGVWEETLQDMRDVALMNGIRV